jgi:hypothetical protein
MSRRATPPRVWIAALAALLSAGSAGCSKPRDPIVIKGATLVLENQSDREWRTVRVTVNDHFTGGVASLQPHGMMTAPLRDFQSGFGLRFEPGRMSVYRVRVTATDSDGKPVALSWGK